MKGSAQVKNVITLTEFFRNQIDGAFQPPMDSLDKEFKEHLVFVFNQALQNLRKEGLSQMAAENIGKMLYRLYMVFGVYKAKKKTYTAAEWIEKLVSIGRDMNQLVAST